MARNTKKTAGKSVTRATSSSISRLADSIDSDEDDETYLDEDGNASEPWDQLRDEDPIEEPDDVVTALVLPQLEVVVDDDESEPDPVVLAVDDDDEEDDDDDRFAEVIARRADEFVCQSCFLIVKTSLRSPREAQYCRDCA